MKYRVLIGILSSNKGRYAARRALVRRTWFSACEKYGLVPKFVMGSYFVNAPLEVDDLLVLPGPDEYVALMPRLVAWCRWASTFSWDYIFKCDDDTLLVPNRLAEIAEQHADAGHNYVGSVFAGDPLACLGGSGCLFSRKAAAVIATAQPSDVGHDDIASGHLLSAWGMPPVDEPRFGRIGAQSPSADNDLATGVEQPLSAWEAWGDWPSPSPKGA